MPTELEILGEHLVYPGHPIAIAWLIIQNFPGIKAASNSQKDGGTTSPAAVRSQEIPGAGGNVYAGLDFLHHLKLGVPFEEAVEEANRVWKCYTSYYKDDRRDKGQVQADRCIPLIATKKGWWQE